jgi:hypothetical protein
MSGRILQIDWLTAAVIRHDQPLERSNQHQPSPSDRGRVERSCADQLIKLGSPKTCRFARFGDCTGEALGKGNARSGYGVLKRRRVRDTPRGVTLMRLMVTHSATF